MKGWGAIGAAIVGTVVGYSSTVRLGVESFVELYRDSLQGKRLALLTHAAARLPDGRLSLEVLKENFRIVAVWAPEHGFWGTFPAGESVPDEQIAGIPVFSLYGARRRPPAELFRAVDAVVVELQDIGIRPYTYLSTLVMVMAACAEFGVPVYVLDRPNPLGGTTVEGAVLDTALRSFVGMLPIPYRHGCTFGELARMANEQGWLPPSSDGRVGRCSLTVVPLRGWRRTMVWEETGLPWFPPSPNIPTPTAARAAGITGIFGEMGLWYIGIGGTTPFQILGAPQFPAERIAAELRSVLLSLGVRVGAIRFVPRTGQYARQECEGLFFYPEARHDARFFEAFTVIAPIVLRSIPDRCQRVNAQRWEMVQKVVGDREFALALCRGEGLAPWVNRGVEEFQKIRQRYLLYP